MIKDIVDNHKSLGGKVKETTVNCPFCGQSILTEVSPDVAKNEDMLRDLAIELCQCDKAKEKAKRMRQRENIEEKTERLLGVKSQNPLDPDVVELVKKNAEMVLNYQMEKVTISLEDNEKIKLSRNKDGLLSIQREIKKVEAEKV